MSAPPTTSRKRLRAPAAPVACGSRRGSSLRLDAATSTLADLARVIDEAQLVEVACVYSMGAWHGRACYDADGTRSVCRARENTSPIGALLAAVRMAIDERGSAAALSKARKLRERKGAAHGAD